MKEKILIIEDDGEVLINLETLLLEEGYEVYKAENGFEGVTAAKEHLPDLIICDILMPKMTGYEVIKTLSILPETETIPFLFLTAKTEIQDIREGMALGADDYLLKPYNIDDLLKSVRMRLRKVAKLKASQIKSIDEHKENKTKYGENDRIFLTIKDEPQFIKVNSIVYLESERQYVNLVFDDDKRVIMRRSLNYWESILPESMFMRIHRSSIVNLNYISKVEKWFSNSYKIILSKNFGQLTMSKRYASKLKQSMK